MKNSEDLKIRMKKPVNNNHLLKCCKLCGFEGFIKAKNLCNTCYELKLKLEKTKSRDLGNSSCPKFLRWFYYQSPFKDNKQKLREASIGALNRLIERRKNLKSFSTAIKVDGIDLEYLIQDIFGRIKKVKHGEVERIYHGTADFFDYTFKPNQKIKLYHFLVEIFYLIPMAPLNALILDEYYDLGYKTPIQ